MTGNGALFSIGLDIPRVGYTREVSGSDGWMVVGSAGCVVK